MILYSMLKCLMTVIGMKEDDKIKFSLKDVKNVNGC